MKQICKNCHHWNNKQAETDYRESKGFCTNFNHKFNTSTGCDMLVLDRWNTTGKGLKTHEFESIQEYMDVQQSRYVLVTDEDFGCINFIKK